MRSLESFYEHFGSGIPYKTDISEILLRFKESLPEVVLERWRQRGLCIFRDGLYLDGDPRALNDLVSDWIEAADAPPIVFGRTAFADLFLWGQDGIHFLNVQTGNVTRISNDPVDFFDVFLCQPKNWRTVLRGDLFEKVHTKLGKFEPDECYAFEPALALGGPGTPDTLRKVKLREHLKLLSQIVLD